MPYGKIILHVLLIAGFQSSLGQFREDFSDGELNANPTWSGDHSKFTINSGKLKLQAPATAGAAYLATPSEAIHLASWEFSLQMDFTPSSTNYAKVYLVSDQSSLDGALNGYFIKAGNTSRDISLYRQTGTGELRVIDGIDDRLNVSLVKVRIKVTRDDSGTWQLYSDAGMSGTYFLEGTVRDNTHITSSYFGIQCVYTSTRSDKFWFDDFVVSGAMVPDRIPPTIESGSVENQNQVRLLFSEKVDRATAENISNYLISSLGTPVSAVLQADERAVWLQFAGSLTNGVTYRLQVSGVRDLAGNSMTSVNVDALYFQPVTARHKDVILTEIYPDPSPQVGLPSVEFVEIYNRSTNPIDLAGWELSDGSSVAIFPKQIIQPGEYWIVASSSSSTLFSALGRTIGLVNFPTLNNSGDNLTLTAPVDGMIDSVSYSLAEYHNADKAEGGWTLEIIDPNNTCAEQDNWTASEDPRGGTPGRQNSVFANKPDLTGPVLFTVFPESATRLNLVFNEKLDESSCSSSHFFIREGVRIKRAFFKDHGMHIIQLELQDQLVWRQHNTIDVTDIRDCSGNQGVNMSWSFGLPEPMERLDLVINEILFNPLPGGSDFVELYNRSAKYLDLRNMKVSNVEEGTPANIVVAFADHRLLAPGDFLVIATDPITLKQHYPQTVLNNVFMVNVPTLPDDAGSFGILDDQGLLIDELTYSNKWHSKFIRNDEGVSLERISPETLTNLEDNWTSASSHAGFATPGLRNSQNKESGEGYDGGVTVVPEIFSPGSGLNEFAEIKYNLDQAGWVANVKILDHQGHHLKTIASNETIGPEGFFRWDGDREDGHRARMGYYIVWFDIFDSNGAVRTFRKRVVVAAQE